MKNSPSCTLTDKDHEILQRMLEYHGGQDEAMTRLLRRKLARARVVARDEVPEDVVTLNSRISFRVGNGPTETRILCLDRTSGPVGYVLPITTLRGLALLGLAEGRTAIVSRSPSLVEIIRLTAVHYQPEKAERMSLIEAARPRFRVLEGGRQAGPVPITAFRHENDGEDPGPSAA